MMVFIKKNDRVELKSSRNAATRVVLIILSIAIILFFAIIFYMIDGPPDVHHKATHSILNGGIM